MMTGIEFPVICVPTDYEIEGWWPHKETDLFCVATEFMAETLRPRKVPERCIEVTGIPIRPGFSEQRDRAQDCAAFGLPVDKKLVLVMAGAALPQPYVRFRAAMEETLPYLRSFENMHFVFLPGKDIAYAKHLNSVFEGMKLPQRERPRLRRRYGRAHEDVRSCDSQIGRPDGHGVPLR